MKKAKFSSFLNIVIIAAVVYIALLLLGGVKNIFQFLGIVKDKTEKKYEDLELFLATQKIDEKKAASVAAYEAVKKQYSEQKSTKSDAEWQNIADIIYQDLKFSSFDDNKEDAGYQVCRVQNDTDVYKLIQHFGERIEYFFGIPTARQTLSQFITSNLSKEKIAIINDNYARKGIKFRF